MASFKNLLRPDLSDYCPASNLAFNEKVREMKSRGELVHHFGFGQAPFPVMEEMVDALKEFAGENSYEPVAGIPELRNAIVGFHTRYDKLTFDPDQIVVGPGSKELIYLNLAVFNGDVLVISPTWTTYKPQSRLAGRRAYVVPTSLETQWRITPQSLGKVIEDNHLNGNKILILCNPDNPTGTSYNDSHLSELASFCRKHNIIVISDEIYARLHYEHSHVSIAKHYPEGTILSTGMSKWASAGGWRLGYHIYPKELNGLRDAVRSAASHTYSCAAAPMQYAVAKTLHNETACHDYILHTTRIMKAVADFCYQELTSVGVTAVRPTAGYYIFPCFDNIRESLVARGITTGAQMCNATFEEARVALMSGGPAFLRPEEEFSVRLCYVGFDGKGALSASRKMGLQSELTSSFVQEHCSAVYDGIKALCKWVKQQN